MDITVIIPSYKPGDYIEDCLKSLGEQTLSASDFEIMIVLNGCNEPWLSQIKNLIEKYLLQNNVHIIQTDTAGVSNARNLAIDIAKGEYLTFIDDDDYVSPKYLEKLLENSSSNCVGLTDSLYFDNESMEIIYDNTHHKEYNYLKDRISPTLFQARRFFNGPVMKLLHRDIIGNRRFDVRFANGEDSLFMALISDRIKSCKLCNSEAVYYRRIRTGSASNTNRKLWSIILNDIKCIEQYCIYWIKNPIKYNIPFLQSRILASIKNILTELC